MLLSGTEWADEAVNYHLLNGYELRIHSDVISRYVNSFIDARLLNTRLVSIDSVPIRLMGNWFIQPDTSCQFLSKDVKKSVVFDNIDKSRLPIIIECGKNHVLSIKENDDLPHSVITFPRMNIETCELPKTSAIHEFSNKSGNPVSSVSLLSSSCW